MLILGCLVVMGLPLVSHWFLLGGGVEAPAGDAPNADGAGLTQSQRNEEHHSLVLFTVVDTSAHSDRPQTVGLEARIVIRGVQNLYRVCTHLPHVMETILDTLTSGSDIVDQSGEIRLASQHGRVRIALNNLMKQDMVRHVRLAPAISGSPHASPRTVCSRAARTMRQLKGNPA